MRLAIVTGGSRGLGREICEALKERHWEVLEFSRSAPHSYSVRTNFKAPVESQRTVERALERFSPDELEELLVVSNAATLEPMGPVADNLPAAIAENISVNITGAVLALAAIVSRFQEARCPKVIVGISSGAALRPYAGWSLYCAAKAGMDHFLRVLAVEQEGCDSPFVPINVNPGVMDTEMQTSIRSATEAEFPQVARFIQRKKDGELADPSQVARRLLKIVESGDVQPGERYDVSDYGP